MLRHDNLDDQTFQDIVGNAQQRIARYIPAWTDQNAHDPGIMLIELFAWLIEMLQFYLNQIKDAAAVLPLLGIMVCHTKPASVSVRLIPAANGPAITLGVPRGTPLSAEDVCFETADPFLCGGTNVIALATCEGHWEAAQVTVVFPFGRSPKAGNRFSIFFDSAYEAGYLHTLEIIVHDPAPGRNPVDPARPPRLVRISWEYLAADGYCKLEANDATSGFLTDGVISFTLDRPMATDAAGRFEIRCTLVSHEYDLPPRIDALQPAVFHAVQQQTLCEDVLRETTGNSFASVTYLSETGETMLFYESGGEYIRIPEFSKNPALGGSSYLFTVSEDGLPAETPRRFHLLNCAKGALTTRLLGYADGFPNQRFSVDCQGAKLIYEDFSLLVGDSYEFSRARKWHKVDNFYRSSATDLHYTLNEQSGEICFGDGLRGAMPKGVVLAASMSLTRGAEGNIAARQLSELRYGGHVLELEQQAPASGGCEQESIAEAIARAGRCLERAVTAEDLEKLVRGTPGLIIDQVKTYAGRTNIADTFDPYRMIVAVKPPGTRARLSEAYRRQIREYLEPFRLAGCEIEIVSPHYVRIDIIAEASIYPYRYGIKENMEKQLRAFFAQTCSSFGAKIERTAFMAELASLPHVERVISMVFRTGDSHARQDEHGDILLEPNALAYWGRLDLLLRG